GIERRQAIAKRYHEAFANTIVQTHESPKSILNAHHLYVVELNNRKEVYDYLREHQIYSQVHYIPVHTQPYYRNLETEKVVMPIAEKYYSRALSLPMYPTLTEEEQEFVIAKVLEIAK
ncbi:MAG: dTDP-4-amino-4,6-dideoxygalactose transaminase, partial [Saprospiraceae bacterium]